MAACACEELMKANVVCRTVSNGGGGNHPGRLAGHGPSSTRHWSLTRHYPSRGASVNEERNYPESRYHRSRSPMNAEDIRSLALRALAASLRRGEISSEAVVGAFLDRIAEVN